MATAGAQESQFWLVSSAREALAFLGMSLSWLSMAKSRNANVAVQTRESHPLAALGRALMAQCRRFWRDLNSGTNGSRTKTQREKARRQGRKEGEVETGKTDALRELNLPVQPRDSDLLPLAGPDPTVWRVCQSPPLSQSFARSHFPHSPAQAYSLTARRRVALPGCECS